MLDLVIMIVVAPVTVVIYIFVETNVLRAGRNKSGILEELLIIIGVGPEQVHVVPTRLLE